MNSDENKEEIKVKGKMYALTTLTVIGVIILYVIICIFSFKSLFNDISKHNYYVLEINDENKEKIISFLDYVKDLVMLSF